MRNGHPFDRWLFLRRSSRKGASFLVGEFIIQAQIRTYNKKYIESCYDGTYKGNDNKRKKYVVTKTNLAMKFYRTGIEKEYHNRQDS